MQKIVASSLAVVASAAMLGAALLWPRASAQGQIGLPVGVADCACTKGTQLDAAASRLFVYICQCGAQQCVISAGTAASGNVAPHLAQTCR